jgi:two-component system NtrC family sensor kinase
LQQLALVERETQRCTIIVRNLLDFARQRPPSFQEVDLLAVLDEALSLVTHRMEIQNLEVVRELAPVPPVRADFGQLRQAVVNILINACDAMAKGGKLRLIVGQVDAGASAENEPSGPVRCAEISIVDQGEGIPAEHLSRIFDPFFSTKEKGTGLGLSVVYGILEKHGGKILVDSRVGEGTTVTLRLPAAGARDA